MVEPIKKTDVPAMPAAQTEAEPEKEVKQNSVFTGKDVAETALGTSALSIMGGPIIGLAVAAVKPEVAQEIGKKSIEVAEKTVDAMKEAGPTAMVLGSIHPLFGIIAAGVKKLFN